LPCATPETEAEPGSAVLGDIKAALHHIPNDGTHDD